MINLPSAQSSGLPSTLRCACCGVTLPVYSRRVEPHRLTEFRIEHPRTRRPVEASDPDIFARFRPEQADPRPLFEVVTTPTQTRAFRVTDTLSREETLRTSAIVADMLRDLADALSTHCRMSSAPVENLVSTRPPEQPTPAITTRRLLRPAA